MRIILPWILGGLLAMEPAVAATVPISSPKKVVLYPANASPQLVATANELTAKLNEMFTGADFLPPQTYTSDSAWPAAAIVLGKGTDLNLTAALPDVWAPATYNAKGREHYQIGASSTGSYLIVAGTTDIAVSRGVYDLLQQLGCRWFFPGANWTITPSLASISWTTPAAIGSPVAVAVGPNSFSMNVYADETPEFKWRFFSLVGGPSDWDTNWIEFAIWAKASRIHCLNPQDLTANAPKPEGLAVFSNHNYGNLTPNHNVTKIKGWANAQDPTQWAPGYHSEIGGVREDAQLGVSNIGPEAGIHQMVKNYVTDYFAQKPLGDMISMEPNDGGGWCECDYCADMDVTQNGYVTNRVVYFANAAATEVPPNKYVAYYGYHTHSAPPGAGKDPATGLTVNFTPTPPEKTYVLITNKFLFGISILTRLAQWRQLSPNLNLGVRDYLNLFESSKALPGVGDLASNLNYISLMPAQYRNYGTDVYTSECTNSWGSPGLGYYLISRKLWKKDTDTNAVKTDFLTKSFGAALSPMTEFYKMLDVSNGYYFSTDMLGRLYRFLQQARVAESNVAVVKRLDDLTLWLRYCELFKTYSETEDPTARLTAYKEVLKFGWQIRATNMIDSCQLFRNATSIEPTFTWPALNDSGQPPPPPDTTWNFSTPPLNHPLKPSTTYTSTQILAFNTAGANLPILPEAPKSFSKDVVPSCRLAATRGSTAYQLKKSAVYMYADSFGSLPQLTIKAGYSGNNNNAAGKLHTTDDLFLGNPLFETSVTTNQTPNTINFGPTGTYDYLSYMFLYNDNAASSIIDWDIDKWASFGASPTEPYRTSSVTYRYFYVPKGTKYVVARGNCVADISFYNAGNARKTFSQELTGTAPVYNKDKTLAGNGWEFIIPVSNDDDQVWYMAGYAAGEVKVNVSNFYFVTVPGLVARSPKELLIPREAYSNLQHAAQTASTAGTFYYTEGPVHLYLYTDANGNLPVPSISTGWKNGTAVSWSLYKEKDALLPANVLQSGTVAADQVAHPISLVPSAGPGCYHFVYNDNTNSSLIGWPAGSRVVHAANPNEPVVLLKTVSRRYFYVPKGTQFVQMKASYFRNACNFYNAAGVLKYAQPVDGNNPTVSIPVGADDGQVWYVTNLKVDNFSFLNIPGYLAVNRDELLVPQWAKNQILNLW